VLREERISREVDRRRSAILSVARDLLGREGMSDFTMERVADEAGYARTAIYRYFSSKEELIVELAVESLALRVELYRRAVLFDARPRERVAAFGEVTCLLYPRHVLPHVFAFAQAVRDRTSDEHQERLEALESEDTELNLSVARDAVESGDLELSFGMTLEETLFGLNSLTQGIFYRIGNRPPSAAVDDPRAILRRMGGRLLDGLGWRPLSSEWDYRATMSRIYTEVFPARFLATVGPLGDPEPSALRSGAGG
jgi:AcrR family transcriptional regulator